MKKIGLLTVGIACAVSLAIGVSASGIFKTITAELRPDFEIVIDGKKQEFKNASGKTVYPILYDGTTYLPVRAIGEMMGKTVYWYQEDKRIEIKDEESLVTDADVIITGRTDKNTDTNSDGRKPEEAVPSDEITISQAKKIALDKAGLNEEEAVFIEAKRERENGANVYELEFRNGGIKYSAEIKASDGSIISWEVEGKVTVDEGTSDKKISLEEAKEIALEKAGLKESDVVFTKAKTDNEKGVDIYEIEFKKGRTEYSADIRISDGSIISWEVEQDD